MDFLEVGFVGVLVGGFDDEFSYLEAFEEVDFLGGGA